MTVVTEFVYPPIPIRSMDWMTYDDDTYCGCGECQNVVGRGATKQGSIADFNEQMAELTKLDTFPDSGTQADPSVRSRTLPDISEAFSSSQPSPSPTTSPITRKAEL